MKKIKNKKTLYILVIILIIIVIVATAWKINRKENNNLSENTSDENINNEYKEEQIKVYVDKQIEISENITYVDDYENLYKNYSRNLEISDIPNLFYKEGTYYIENEKVYYKNEEETEITEIYIDGKKAKYLGIGGHSCSGGPKIYVLTTDGSIYLNFIIDNNSKTSFSKVDLDNPAEELVIIQESEIFTTCGITSDYVLIDGKLIDIENKKTREENHPYSLTYTAQSQSLSLATIVLYSDGSLDKYLYGSYYYRNEDLKNELVYINDGQDKLIASYIYELDDSIYIVSNAGIIYKVIIPSDYYSSDKLVSYDIEMQKEFSNNNLRVNEIKVYSYYDNDEKKIKNELTLYYNDGSIKEYKTDNGDNLEISSQIS